jgi:hypothetical protein
MRKSQQKKTLYDAYRFDGFTPARELKGVFGERKLRILRLNRRSKKQFAVPVAPVTAAGTTKKPDGRVTSHAVTLSFTWSSTFVGLNAESVKP